MGIIRVSKYSTWLIINFVLGLIPFYFLIILDKGIDNESFNSFLTFGFTFLVSSTYIFHIYSNKLASSNLFIVLSIVVSFIYLSVYVIVYAWNPEWVYRLIVDNLKTTFFLMLLVLLAISFALNFNAIEAEIKHAHNEKQLRDSDDYESLLEKFKNKKG